MNTNNIKNLFIVTALSLIAIGCSARNSAVHKVAICKHNYDPFPVEKNKSYSGKLELKPGEPLGIPAADYAYTGSEVFYYNSATDIKLHLKHAKNSLGEMDVNVLCIGGKGIDRSMPRIEDTVPVVTDLYIDAAGASKIRTSLYRFVFDLSNNAKPFQTEVTIIEGDYVDGSPNDLYTDFADKKQYFATLNSRTPSYQLISHLKNSVLSSTSGKTDYLKVRAAVSMRPVDTDERNKIDHPADDNGYIENDIAD